MQHYDEKTEKQKHRSLQILNFLKAEEEQRQKEQKEAAQRPEDRNNLLRELISVFKK